MTTINPIRVSFASAAILLAVSIVQPLPGLIFAAMIALAIGQLATARDRPHIVRAALFLASGSFVLALQVAAAVTPQWSLAPADVPLAVGIATAVAVLAVGKSRKRVAQLSAVVLAVGLWLSSLDPTGISVYWRAKILAVKLSGGLPVVSWLDVSREVFGVRTSFALVDADRWATVIDRREGPIGDVELFRTELGDVWAPATSRDSVALIAKEMTALREYEFGENWISPGDVVIDCGAHVGFYTKLALARGAGLVVAVEPDPENYWCFRENLRDEIADGRVRLLQVGVWDKQDTLTFYHSTTNPGAHTFLGRDSSSIEYENVPVLPLDDLVAQLGLERIDAIKMDIEGAERRALKGAANVLRNYKPKLAICTYHRDDDADVIPPIVFGANPEYSVHAKHIVALGKVRPKILFFR